MPLDDQVAAEAATWFYHRMPDSPTAEHAAAVLRDVTLHLRDEYPNRPDLRAPLVHTGP